MTGESAVTSISERSTYSSGQVPRHAVVHDLEGAQVLGPRADRLELSEVARAGRLEIDYRNR